MSSLLLYVVRHAAAAEREGFPLADDLRPITAKGRRRFQKVAERFAEEGERADALLTSPLVRAVQTAEILAGASGYRGEVEIAPALAPPSAAATVLDLVRARDERAVAVVGHEPQLGELAAMVLGRFDLPFKKGMMLALSLPRRGGAGELRFAIVPRSHDGKGAELLRTFAALDAALAGIQ